MTTKVENEEGEITAEIVTNDDAPTTAKEEEPAKDEEGLLLSYDVIICGTGLVQSILASALTRAGKTVLHCDPNDHYGELDTVWTFGYMQERQQQPPSHGPEEASSEEDDVLLLSPEGSYQTLKFHSTEIKTDFPVTTIGCKVQTPYGEGTVVGTQKSNEQNDGIRLEISMSKWTMADGTHPTLFMCVPNNHDEGQDETRQQQKDNNNKIVSLKSIAARRVLQQQSRSLALDVNPCLLYASGQAVQGLLTSNVAEHLEFQTMAAVYWLNHNNNNKLERVPCSKGDVFQSSLLPSPMDKRRFMKFFQSAMDYATERELQQQQLLLSTDSNNNNNDNQQENTEEGVLSLNERQLNQGRSLARPQNKAVSQKDLQTLYDCMEQNMDFETYLQTHAKLSPQLRQLIRHALALEVGGSTCSGNENQAVGLSTLEGMGRLCDHLKALGRYGTTAFLTLVYGSGEMSQFFCRSAAVYGATYLLRRVPKAVTWTSDNNNAVSGVTLAASDDAFMGAVPAKEKHVQATHVVIAQDAKLLTKSLPPRRELRRISIIHGSVVPDASRSVIIIPPGGILEQHNYAIHGIVLDESARVVPAGCNVLHLTTIVDQTKETVDDSTITAVLDQAVKVILESSGDDADEIYQTTFSYGLLDDDDDDGENHRKVSGLHVLKRPAMPLIVDEAFEQARGIFQEICGNEEEFLALSEQMQTKLKEQLQDAYRGPNQVEDDTEQVVLDSAMEMMKEQSADDVKEDEKKAHDVGT